MNTSAEIGELAKALAAAQGEMKNPPLDGKNPHFQSRFATLAAVRDAAIPALTKHGIALTQELTGNVTTVGCTTRLTHTSGQWMEFGPFLIPVSKPDAQGFGAASTYARRFCLQSVLGLVGDDDDDGEEAVGRGARKPAKKDAPPANEDFPPPGPIGKPSAPPPVAPKAAEPAAGPPMTADALEGLPLMDICKIHAAKLGRALTNAEIEACGGDTNNRAKFGLDEQGVLLLRKVLISQLLGGVK